MSSKHHDQFDKPHDVDKIVKGFEKEKRRRELRKASKQQMKPNPDASKPRRRDWFDAAADEEAGDSPASERIMPRGLQDYRRTVERRVAMADKTSTTPLDTPLEVDGQPLMERPAPTNYSTVVEVSTGLCRVVQDGQTLICRLRGALSASETGYTNIIAVGDRVVISKSSQESGVIEEVLPRRNVLARPDVYNPKVRQILATNVDQLLIVASWRNPDIWLELIDRYYIAATQSEITPVLCVNKVDLAEHLTDCERLLRPYQELLGMQIILTSASNGHGIDALRLLLKDRITVLAGMSGVGKSSLLSAVQPGLNLRTAEVSTFDRQGRHTTTQAAMLPLQTGGYVIDTPGIREFGLFSLKRNEISLFYPEFEKLDEACRFANCAHIDEHDCAVKTAVAQGKIADWRYHNYVKLYRMLPA